MKENVKEMKPMSPKLRQQNYEENFTLLRKGYPKVARWLENSGNGKAIAVELGDDAAALLGVYTKLKEAIEAAKEITVEELP